VEVNIEISKTNSFFIYSQSKCGDSKIYAVDEEVPTSASFTTQKHNNEVLSLINNRKRSKNTLPPLRIFPISNNNLYSPIPTYTNVKIELAGGAKWEFSEIQDDMGNDAGFAIDEKELKARLKDTDLQAPFEYDWTHHEGQGIISVCRVIIPEIDINHFTVVIGIPNLDCPLIGRFMIGDSQNKLYAGYLADTIYLPLNEEGKIVEGTPHPVEPNTYSLTKLPNWDNLISKYRKTIQGKKTFCSC